MSDEETRDTVSDTDVEDDTSTATGDDDSSGQDATAGEEGGEEESGKETDTTAKRDRKVERIKRLAARSRKAEERVVDLEEQVKHLTKLAAEKSKGGKDEEVSVDDLEDLGYTEQQLKQLKTIVNKAGGISELKEELKSLKGELKKERESKAISEDAREKKEILKKYDGIIDDEEEMDEMLKELQSDSNPRVRAIANAPWETIVRHFKGDEIAERAADESIKSKKKSGPNIKGKGSKAEPVVKREPLPAGDMASAQEALIDQIMQQMAEEE